MPHDKLDGIIEEYEKAKDPKWTKGIDSIKYPKEELKLAIINYFTERVPDVDELRHIAAVARERYYNTHGMYDTGGERAVAKAYRKAMIERLQL